MRLLARAARATRGNARLVAVLYLLEAGLAAVLAFIVWRTFTGAYASRPLFSRGVAGDDTALILALIPQAPALGALAWAAAGLLIAWALASMYLGAGLLGALAGRRFTETANGRALAFARLALLSLLPYVFAAALALVGIRSVGLELGDLTSAPRLFGRALLGASLGLAVAVLTACAVDQARAELVLGDGRALRALGRGYRTALRRPAALGLTLLYLVTLAALAGLYLAVAGTLGALLLFVLRQLHSAARFTARTVTSAAQVALQLDVLELGELAKRPEARGDVGVGQPADPVE